MKNLFGYGAVLTVALVLVVVTMAVSRADAATAPALAAAKDSAATGHNAEGIDHYNQEHWDVAAKHFRGAIGDDANSAEAHYNLALSLDKMGQHKEATEHFKKALELGKDNPAIANSEILKKHLGM